MKYFLILILLCLNISAQERFYPAQYIAKLYTEGLGRAPDQMGYFGYVRYFQGAGCSTDTLQIIGWQILTSQEFKNLNYINEARIFVVFRSLLNREPAKDELGFLIGKDYTESIKYIFSRDEFNYTLAKTICRTISRNNPARYGWRGSAIANSLVISEDELLQRIYNAESGVVRLPQRSTVFLTKPLVLNGITLQTEGNPSEYANMARLVRANNFKGSNGCGQSECGEPLIKLIDCAKLSHIWADGNGQALTYRVWDVNIQILGENSTVENCRVDNSAGFSNIQTIPAYTYCSAVIKNNFILGYNSDGYVNHKSPIPWVDGITASCETTTIANNQIIDTSDVSIVIFSPRQGLVQNSKIYNNVIFNAGNSSFAAFNTDHIFVNYPADFSGTVFSDNLIWTSDFVSLRTGISVGSDLWGNNGGYGFGATFINNSTGIGFIKAHFGTLFAGMRQPIYLNNKLNYKLGLRCKNLPAAAIAASDTGIPFVTLPFQITVDASAGCHE